MEYQPYIIAAVGALLGWILRSFVGRLITRADADHDTVIRLQAIMDERDRKWAKDIQAAHEKIRQLNGG